jgi:HSP20 family protein
MRRFAEDMESLLSDFGFGGGFYQPSSLFFGPELFSRMPYEMPGMWSPQVEVFERNGQLMVRADLPGLTKDDVRVEVTDDRLIIEGERRNEQEEKGEGFYRSELSYGRFFREIPLPEGASAQAAQATFKNGVLEVTMPVPQAQKRGRRLEIRAEGESEKAKAKSATTGS